MQVRILHLALVDDLSPVAVLPVEAVPEADLFRRDEAERRVVDLQVADARRQSNGRRRGAAGQSLRSNFVIRDQTLDMDRRSDRIERKAMRVDDLDAF